MSSLLYLREPSYQSRMNAIVWWEIPAWELWKSTSRGRPSPLMMWCSGWLCLFVFMVATLSNQKITATILLDLFLMAFFSSLLFWRKQRRSWWRPHQIPAPHKWHKDGDRRRGFIRFLLLANEMRENCQDCILTPQSSLRVSPNNTISVWPVVSS